MSTIREIFVYRYRFIYQVCSSEHAALRDNRAADALTLLDQHAQSFPKGAFAEEDLVARITAFCALGRTAEARRVVARFRRELPTSAYRALVDDSCAGTRAP